MKKLRALAAVMTLAMSYTMTASDGKGLKGSKVQAPSIRVENNLVSVSILNRELAQYRVAIYDEYGELMYQGGLGDEISLGKMFDFSIAKKGYYTFKFSNDNGYRFSYQLKVGV
ncbi:hypothetical protein ACFQ1M_03135 [Sungkyunkwania multivorans]|uniref:Uncharacterized protein n=1 Tax=Sungkyunkwania multivorans TaxID=1173618 RepID=A0ABW3CV74_9FLAO